MMSKRDAMNRAVNLAITTGQMPNLSLTWAFQKDEGSKQCFGRINDCDSNNCRWLDQCKQIVNG